MTRKLIAAAILCLTFSAPAFADTWTGLISDSMCANKHHSNSAADIECAKKCVRSGIPAVLVVGVKVYKIDNQAAVKSHVGKNVTITGSIKGDTIHVDAVKA